MPEIPQSWVDKVSLRISSFGLLSEQKGFSHAQWISVGNMIYSTLDPFSWECFDIFQYYYGAFLKVVCKFLTVAMETVKHHLKTF